MCDKSSDDEVKEETKSAVCDNPWKPKLDLISCDDSLEFIQYPKHWDEGNYNEHWTATDKTGWPTISEEEEKTAFESILVTLRQVIAMLTTEQGSDAWLLARLFRLGASIMLLFMGLSDKGSIWDAYASILGVAYIAPSTQFMFDFGHKMESTNDRLSQWEYKRIMNDRYEAWVASGKRGTPCHKVTRVEVHHEGTLIWQQHPMISASIDGCWFVYFEDGSFDVFLAEYKCTQARGGYGGVVFSEYFIQMQQQMTIVLESRRLDYLISSRGLSRDNLVPGWEWRCLFSVFARPDNGITQMMFVRHEKDKYMKMAHCAIERWYAEVLPRMVLKQRGQLRPHHVNYDPIEKMYMDTETVITLDYEKEDADMATEIGNTALLLARLEKEKCVECGPESLTHLDGDDGDESSSEDS